MTCIRTLAAMSIGLLGACGPTDVGNPVTVDFTLYDDADAGQARVGPERGGVGAPVVESAWLAIERLRIRDAATCAGNAEIERVGPYAVDLLAPGALPALTDIDIPSSSYCRFELRWERFRDPLPGGAPVELSDASLVLLGTRADGVAFAIRSERDDEFRLDAVDGVGFVIDEATNGLFVGFEQQALLAGIDLDAAVVGDDGRILIDSTSNEELADIFDGNLQAAARLFDDDDDDDELDPTERTPDEVLAE